MKKFHLSEKLQKISVVKFFAISYIVIFAVSIIVNLVIYANVDRKVIARVNEYNSSILKSRAENTDKLMSDVSTNAAQVSLLSDIDDALTLTKDYTVSERFELLKCMANIGYQISEQIEKSIIYCHNSELILSTKSVDDAERYYNAYFSQYFDSYESWQEYIDNTPSGNLQKLPGKRGIDDAVIYIYHFFAVGRPDCKGTIITQLNNSVLFSDADMIEILENSDGEIIASNTEEMIDKNNGEYIPFEFKSEYLDLNYVYMMPKKSFYSAFSNVRYVIIIGNIIYAILALLIIWYFTNIHSASIGNVIATIRKKEFFNDDGKELKALNEYELIDTTINNLIKKYEESVSRSMLEEKTLVSSVMSEFVKGEYYGATPIEEYLKKFGIEFNQSSFYLALIHIDDTSELFFENNDDKYESYELAKFIFQNVYKDVAPKNINGLFFEVNKVLVCVFNMQPGTVLLDHYINQLSKLMSKNFNIHFKTAISNVHHSIDELPIAYTEAIRASQERYTSNDLLLRPKKRKVDRHGYVYTFEREQQITNYMHSGNCEGAKSLIVEILNDYYKHSDYSEDMIKCLISDIYATFLKLLDISGNTEAARKATGKLGYTGTYQLDDVIYEISKFIDTVIEYTEISDVPKKNIAQRADEIILQEYNSLVFNVNYLAEKLGVRANYLSAKYKSIRGIALLDYINMMRVEKAKEILDSDDSKNLEEISVEIGFASVRTFSRVFTKFVGTTPGEYRNRNRKQQ